MPAQLRRRRIVLGAIAAFAIAALLLAAAYGFKYVLHSGC